jgi:hypothetical protein
MEGFMKLIMLLLFFSSIQASQTREPDLSYPDYSCFQHCQSSFLAASAPYGEEEKINPVARYYHRLSQQTNSAEAMVNSQEETMLVRSPLLQQQLQHNLEEELTQLTQENKALKDKIDIMTTLLAENNQMLKALLPALHAQGAQIDGLENGQVKIEDHLLNMMQKLKHWKTEMPQSYVQILTQILKWFKIGFNISTGVGTAVTTYYTIAYLTAVLPSALTPPGWILLTTSAATGALYYIVSDV